MSKLKLPKVKAVEVLKELADKFEKEEMDCEGIILERQTQIVGADENGWIEEGYTGYGTFHIKFYSEKDRTEGVVPAKGEYI